jgi:hypothetical protein
MTGLALLALVLALGMWVDGGLALGTLVDRLMVACFTIIACLSILCWIPDFFFFFFSYWFIEQFCVEYKSAEWGSEVVEIQSGRSS